jgi:hypothetical protein
MKTILFILCCLLLISCKKKDETQIILSSITDVGAVSGHVTTITGDTLVEGAMITTEPFTNKVFSDSAGNYTLPDMPPGNYTIIATKEGFTTDSTTVSLIDWRTVSVSFALAIIKPSPGFSFTGSWSGKAGPLEDPMTMSLVQLSADSITGKVFVTGTGLPWYMIDPGSTWIASQLVYQDQAFTFATRTRNAVTGDIIPGTMTGTVVTNDSLTGHWQFVATTGVPYDLLFRLHRGKK